MVDVLPILRESRKKLVPHPIEVKSAMTYSPALYKNLQKYMKLEPLASNPTLIYGGNLGTLEGVNIVSFNQVAQLVKQD